jgi:putative phosphotransacetylase
MPPEYASAAGLQNDSTVSVNITNERSLVLGNVKVRVDASFTLEMHLDTDEANACNVKTGDMGKIFPERKGIGYAAMPG